MPNNKADIFTGLSTEPPSLTSPIHPSSLQRRSWPNGHFHCDRLPQRGVDEQQQQRQLFSRLLSDGFQPEKAAEGHGSDTGKLLLLRFFFKTKHLCESTTSLESFSVPPYFYFLLIRTRFAICFETDTE